MPTEKIKISCSCGSSDFKFPKFPQSTDMLECAQCGASDTYGNVKKHSINKIKSKVISDIKDIFKKVGIK